MSVPEYTHWSSKFIDELKKICKETALVCQKWRHSFMLRETEERHDSRRPERDSNQTYSE
jgi:hypothetical protein